ncbi:MAG: hypothetical protein JJU03_14005 [Idiomarina sp.]|nr:hypothetical protein [Idiomarina sp.]
MKDINAQQSGMLRELSMKIIAGEVDVPGLLPDGCLSLSALTNCLNEKLMTAGLPTICPVFGLNSAPHLYPLVRELKLQVQDIDADTAKRYAQVITEASVLVQVEENNKARSLIQARVIAPHRALVAIAAQVRVPEPDYWLMTDEQLIDKAAEFKSVTMMKYFYCTLHAHLRGRNLEESTLKMKPAVAEGEYIDVEGRYFAKYSELVTANYLRLNDIKHTAQYTVPDLSDGKISIVADFYLPDANLLIEVTQSDEVQSSKRTALCSKRLTNRKAQYQAAGYTVLFINSVPFIKESRFNIAGYVNALKAELDTLGITTGTNYTQGELGFPKSKEERVLALLPVNEFIGFMESQGVDGRESLSGPFRFFLEVINLRPDRDFILQHFAKLDARSQARPLAQPEMARR